MVAFAASNAYYHSIEQVLKLKKHFAREELIGQRMFI
jgi:hypothetical protein